MLLCIFQAVQKITEFRLSQDNVHSVQICWNPVLSSTFAVCLENGGLQMYGIKEQGFEFHTIGPNEKAK